MTDDSEHGVMIRLSRSWPTGWVAAVYEGERLKSGVFFGGLTHRRAWRKARRYAIQMGWWDR